MLDSNTLYLLLAMVGFVFVAIAMINHHSNSDQIRKKRSHVKGFTNKLNQKIDAIEKEIVNLKVKVDDLEDEINSYHTSG
ncbi:hypothetical protein OAN24_05010 [Pseudodesulfovibrio sp.]|nr:hypothetical protein [Pseudodesulfovibrio sp.]